MLRSPGTPTPVILVMTKPVILIVEENAIVRAAVAERLRVAGFEVVEVATSAEADCVLRTISVDALIQTTFAA
jgi:DNA-binding response OmpR family regulator